MAWQWPPEKREALNQCWCDVGPTGLTLHQHWFDATGLLDSGGKLSPYSAVSRLLTLPPCLYLSRGKSPPLTRLSDAVPSARGIPHCWLLPLVGSPPHYRDAAAHLRHSNQGL